MTAINILRLPESVHLFSDTRLSAGGKSNIGNVSKIHPVLHLNAVIATRGLWSSLDAVVRMVVPQAKNFADLRRILTDEFQGLCTAAALRGEPLAGDVDVFVVGWDDGPQAFMVSNHSGHSIDAWNLTDIPAAMITPTISDDVFRALEGNDNPFTAMQAVIAAQARASEAVGGMVMVATVRAEGIILEPFGLINDEFRVAA